MYGTLISSVTVGAGGAASIDFTSIPQTYTDLVLVISAKSTVAGGVGVASLFIRPNGSTTSATTKYLRGNGTAVASANLTDISPGYLDGSSNTAFNSSYIYIPNYTGSTNKSFSAEHVEENNATLGIQIITAGLWSNTAAITSINVTTDAGGSFAQYSTAYLYGLLKGSGGATAS